MTIGIRAHDLGVFDSPAELAREARIRGFDTVQLVIPKVFRGIPRRPGLLGTDLADRIREAFAAEGVGIAMLGAYFDWFHDTTDGPLIFAEHLAAAIRCGADLVGTEAQGLTVERWGPNPLNETSEAFEQAVAMSGRLADAAAGTGARVGIEGAVSHVLSTPEKLRDAADRAAEHAVELPGGEVRESADPDRPPAPDSFRFIFDLYNFLDRNNWENQQSIIDRAVTVYGQRLAVVHCKDFRAEADRLVQVPPGGGQLDHSHLMKSLTKAGLQEVPFILEGVTGDDIDPALEFLRRLGDRSPAP